MASAVAGSSSGRSGPSAPSAPRQAPAHAAFPSLIPRAAIRQPHFNPSKDKLPTSTESLLSFLQTYSKSADQLLDNVVPTLLHLTGHGTGVSSGPGGAFGGIGGERKWGGHDDEDVKTAHADASAPASGKGKGKGKGKGGDERVVRAEKMIAKLPLGDPDDVALATNTAIYLFIVTACLETDESSFFNISTVDFASRLVAAGNVRQLRACGPRLATFAWDILNLGKRLKKQSEALTIVHMLLEKCYGQGRGELSGVHAPFLHGCLSTRQYDLARPLLTGVYIDIKETRPSYRDVITFFHHAGLICAALQEWELAVEHFMMCVSVPTLAASAIQVAAMERAYLCGLLHNGKLPKPPKYMSNALTRAFEKTLGPYTDVGKHYMSANWQKVEELAGNKVFKEDANVGLMEQVVASIPAQKIRIISETISRLTLGDLVVRLGSGGKEDEEGKVLDLLTAMNDSGKLFTRITDNATPSLRVISFLPCTQDFDSPAALEKLKRMTALSDFLDVEMRRASREAGVGEAYLKRQMHQLENRSKGETTGVDVMQQQIQEGEGRKVRGVGGNMGDMGF